MALETRRTLVALGREPIVHFLLIGGLLFVVLSVLNPSDGNRGNDIVVDRDALLAFMQYRTNAFEFDLFNRQLDDLSPAERRILVDEYVREEVLYREALAMGLEQGDYIIRQRIVQKLEFLLEGSVAEGIDPTPSELEEYYRTYEADYAEGTVYTFTQVFFDRERRGSTEARSEAERTLVELNRNRVPSNAATGHGDRPLFYQNYVERTRDFVEDHLGAELTQGLDAVEPSDSSWIGPLESSYGWHLVLLTERVDARVPSLDELVDRVREDYIRLELDRARRASVDRIIGEYEVEITGIDVGGE